MTSLKSHVTASDCTRKISLFSVGGDGYSVQGFIHCAEALPSSVPVNYHYTKVSVFQVFFTFFLFEKRLLSCVSLMSLFFPQDPPLWLSVDKTSSSGIELDEDGVWNIVGGKVRFLFLIVYAFDVSFVQSSEDLSF